MPAVQTTLHFGNPFELMIAVMLSAQCTDVQVNKTTSGLFRKYRTPEDFAVLSQDELEQEIKGCGLYRNKSRHIIATANLLLDKHQGQVPDNRADLMALPGVGRKTANVILSQAFDQPTFPVDTHVFRVSRRLGLSAGRTPLQVEKDLLTLIPDHRKEWHLRLINFGRTTCLARNPRCHSCVVQAHCHYFRDPGTKTEN